MKETISGKYLAILALAAAGILYIGGRFRPRAAETAPPPTETAILQESVRRDQAAAVGQYLASRAAELSEHVVFLPSRGTSGIRYESATKVLTVDGSSELIEPALMVTEIAAQGNPAPVTSSPRKTANWMLILARSSSDEPLWTAVIHGAKQTAVCNDVKYEELVVNATLPKSFTGAGVFDIDGNLKGIVLPCGGTLRVVSIGSVPALLQRSSSADRAFLKEFGFRAAAIPPGWQELYPRVNGLMITDVWLGGWADRNGLLPGDVIITDDAALRDTTLGTELKTSRPGRPGITRLGVQSTGDDTGVAVIPARSSLPKLLVAHGSAAERAGLRTGDHLVSILGQRDASVASLSKLLAPPGGKPVRIVYERGNRRGLVEVPHE